MTWRTLPSGTKLHVKNLLKLSAFLRQLPDPDKFDMDMFLKLDGVWQEIDDRENLHSCGAAACAIGWGPSAGIRVFKTDETWVAYSLRTMINSTWGAIGSEWRWCFDGLWSSVDNTPQGAADRIDWLLEHGMPENHPEQMSGRAPLCYQAEAEE